MTDKPATGVRIEETEGMRRQTSANAFDTDMKILASIGHRRPQYHRDEGQLQNG
jgi:hypothetical protein